MKSLLNVLLLVVTILFSGCAAVEYGVILNDHRGDLMSLNTETGKRFYDVYFDYLFLSPTNAPKAKAHFQKYGFPDYIYCEGQLNNYLIYSNKQLRNFHFGQSLIGLLEVKTISSTKLPYAAQRQLEQIEKQKSLEKQRIENQKSLEKHRKERLSLEQRWADEYQLEILKSVNN